MPDPVEPIDAAGQPLPGEPAADGAVADLAGRGQMLRERGLLLRTQAAEIRANADLMRGNIGLVRGGIAQADASLTLAGEQLGYRREVVGQAGQALTLAQEKAAKVAAGAPGFKAQADEGAADSGPMATETSQLAAENAAQAPDDADAAEKAQEQGGKIAQVQQGSATMDQAIRGTGEKATSLAADAERAKGVNEQTAAKLTGLDETLASTDERLGQMRETTQTARESVEALAGEPDTLTASAAELDLQGAGLVAASVELEQRLRSVQGDYGAAMRAVPAQEFVAEEEGAVVQRQPEEEGAPAEPPPAAIEASEPVTAGGAPATDRYEAREQVDLVSGLPTWLTGVEPETEAARQQRKAEADKRRAEEIAQIEAWTGDKFDELNGFEKAGMALALSGRRLWRKIAGIGWPDWRKAGKLLVSLLDPRTALTGVVSGLSMTLSGFVNLGQLSLTGIVEDPWGSLQNLLKSAADIATGITIVLGSITALAGAIAAIMTAITILSFGFAAPITGPIIAFCTSVMVTVGGWTILVGKIALLLQALGADQEPGRRRLRRERRPAAGAGRSDRDRRGQHAERRHADRRRQDGAGRRARDAAQDHGGRRRRPGRGVARRRGTHARWPRRARRGRARPRPRAARPAQDVRRLACGAGRPTASSAPCALARAVPLVAREDARGGEASAQGRGILGRLPAREGRPLVRRSGRGLDVDAAHCTHRRACRAGHAGSVEAMMRLGRERGHRGRAGCCGDCRASSPVAAGAGAGRAGDAHQARRPMPAGMRTAEEAYDSLQRRAGAAAAAARSGSFRTWRPASSRSGSVSSAASGAAGAAKWTGRRAFPPQPAQRSHLPSAGAAGLPRPDAAFRGDGRRCARWWSSTSPASAAAAPSSGSSRGRGPFYVKIRAPDGRTATLRFADEEAYAPTGVAGKSTPGAGTQVDLIRELGPRP